MTVPRAWIKTLAVVSTMAVVVGACGSGAATQAPSASGNTAPAPSGSQAAANPCGNAPVTLNIWGGYPEVDAVYKLAGENFKKTHPNVDFTVFSTDLRGFEQKLSTALPSKTAGDVVVRTTNFLSRFIDQGLLAPLPADLKTFVTGGAYDPAIVADNTYANNNWGVPLFIGTAGIYYNTDMFTKAGITTPPTSMDEIIADAKKLAVVDASGNVSRSGLSLRLKGQGSGVAEKFWILLLQSGRTLIKETSPGKWQADYNGPEGVKLFQMYADLLKSNVDSLNVDSDAKAFETNATAMFLREAWVIPEIATKAPALVGHYQTISPPVASLVTSESMRVGVRSVHEGAGAADLHGDDLGLAAGSQGPRPDRVPRGKPDVCGLLHSPRWLQVDLHSADRGVRRDRDKARHAPCRSLCRLREPRGPTRQDPDAAQHLGRRDQLDPQDQRPLRQLMPSATGAAGHCRDARRTHPTTVKRRVDG
jgi:multiple sugar transport system substrate-binding protein